MNAQELQSIAESKGFRWVNNCAYGTAAGYPLLFRLNGTTRGNIVTVMFSLPGAAAYKAIKPTLKTGLKKIASHQMLNNDALLIALPAKAETLDSNLTAAISCVTSALRENGIGTPEICPICGQPNCDSLAHVGSTFRPVHKSCLDGAYSAAKEKSDANKANGNFALGLIGAILGGVVGCIPSLFSIFLLERIAAILYALIPLGIYYGYKLLNGRMNKSVKWITVVLSLLFAVGIEFAVLAVTMAQYNIPLELMGMFLKDKDVIDAFLSEVPMSLIFVVLGIVIAWGQISKTADSAVSDAESTLATVVPYDTER